jgi:O-antigen/teichoic acid export membrane protein
MVGGFAWTGIDQLLSSVSNLVVSLAVARAGGAEALGSYTIAFAVYLMVLGFQRSLISEPLMTMPVRSAGPFDEQARSGLSVALLYLIPVSMVISVVGFTIGRSEVTVIGLFLPFVGLQDLYRYLFFRHRRAEFAAVLDGVWVVSSIVGWVWIARTGSATVAVIVWAIGGTLGALTAMGLSRATPHRLRRGLAWWWAEARPLGGFLAIEGVLFWIFAQVNILGLAAILGAAELGTLRAAEIVLGPVGLALMTFNVYVLPRLAGDAVRLTERTAILISTVAGGLAAVSAIGLWIVAPVAVPLLYGESLEVPRVILLALGIRMTLAAFATGPVLLLKTRRSGAPIAVARLVSGLVGTPLVLGTAFLFGLIAAVWAGLVPLGIYLLIVGVGWLRGLPKSSATSGQHV